MGYDEAGIVAAAVSATATRLGAWRSLVAHLLWEQRVGGSNPSAPTKFKRVHSGDMGNTQRA